jgi:hypothetical protein
MSRWWDNFGSLVGPHPSRPEALQVILPNGKRTLHNPIAIVRTKPFQRF